MTFLVPTHPCHQTGLLQSAGSHPARLNEDNDGERLITNAQGGMELATDIMRSIANEYGWPDFHSAVRTEVNLSSDALKQYVGAYQMRPGIYMTIMLSGDQLVSQLTGQESVPLFA